MTFEQLDATSTKTSNDTGFGALQSDAYSPQPLKLDDKLPRCHHIVTDCSLTCKKHSVTWLLQRSCGTPPPGQPVRNSR